MSMENVRLLYLVTNDKNESLFIQTAFEFTAVYAYYDTFSPDYKKENKMKQKYGLILLSDYMKLTIE